MFFEVFDILFLIVVKTNIWEAFTDFADGKVTFFKVKTDLRMHFR